MRVYLAGPVAGLSYDETVGWRRDAAQYLGLRGIETLSPMRGKKYLKDVTCFDGTKNYGGPLASPKSITTRDRFDTTTCDVLLVNLLGAGSVSVGSVLEIAWADSQRIPIVLVMEEHGNVHEHVMLREIAGYQPTDLSTALAIVASICNAAEPPFVPMPSPDCFS